MGKVFTFIIDFLDSNSNVQFRIDYQDAASTPPSGFLPEDINNIDLVILCAASFQEVKNYPEGILNRTKPKHIIIGHWENFFRSYEKSIRTVPFTNVKKFIQKVKNAKSLNSGCKVPKTGSCIVYKMKIV